MILEFFLSPLFGGILAWWVGTGVLFVLARAANRMDPGLLVAGASGAALAAGTVTVGIRSLDSAAGIVTGFAMGIMLWGWHELAFLSGVVTGPERRPCPPELKGWARFQFGFRSLKHHEIALASTVVILGLASIGAANAMPFLTFLLLWGMRISAKLNLFFGVRVPNRHLFPARIQYLSALTPPRRPGAFYLVSTGLVFALTVALFHHGLGLPDGGVRTGWLLLATLSLLAALEHVAMAIPLRLEGLWGFEPESRARPGG
jgi:putative photosynthetic complex assembly protein 2